MNSQTKVTGVVLAGGLARRMGGKDKGLVLFKGQPLIKYALQAMEKVASEVVINANRNQAQYQNFGYPVIADQTDQFDGPLAGILSVMMQSDANVLLVMPCDSPLFIATYLQRLLDGMTVDQTDIAVAFDGERLQPVFLALKNTLKSSLKTYLTSGQRKIDRWLEQHRMTPVDFRDHPEIFMNINTLQELSDLEQRDE